MESRGPKNICLNKFLQPDPRLQFTVCLVWFIGLGWFGLVALVWFGLVWFFVLYCFDLFCFVLRISANICNV